MSETKLHLIGNKTGTNRYFVEISCVQDKDTFFWGIDIQAGTSGYGYDASSKFSEGKSEKDCITNGCCRALWWLYRQQAMFFTDNNKLSLLDKLIEKVNTYLKAQNRPKVTQLELF